VTAKAKTEEKTETKADKSVTKKQKASTSTATTVQNDTGRVAGESATVRHGKHDISARPGSSTDELHTLLEQLAVSDGFAITLRFRINEKLVKTVVENQSSAEFHAVSGVCVHTHSHVCIFVVCGRFATVASSDEGSNACNGSGHAQRCAHVIGAVGRRDLECNH
jgi:hypothetical protein